MNKMLGTKYFDREQSELSNSVRRPEIPMYHALANNESISHLNSRENEIGSVSSHGHNSGGTEL